MAKLLVLNGPNLNLLGIREPEIYGSTTLDDIRHHCEQWAVKRHHELYFKQSNAEAELVQCIHQARVRRVDFIVINPAAFTHTSVAIRDALQGVAIPFIELHMSNVFGREPFRHHSYFSDVAVGVMCGFGSFGYELALRAAEQYLGKRGKA